MRSLRLIETTLTDGSKVYDLDLVTADGIPIRIPMQQITEGSALLTAGEIYGALVKAFGDFPWLETERRSA